MKSTGVGNLLQVKSMFKHFLVVALRNLIKNKIYSLIAIAGLTLGLVAGVIIFIINYSELTWNKWWPDSENIFIVQQKSTFGNNSHINTYTSPLLKKAIDEFGHDVEYSGRILSADVTVELINAKTGQKAIFEDAFYQMDSSMINIFSLTALQGNFSDFYNNKQAVILTEDAAKKYFGSGDPLGRTLIINGRNMLPGQEQNFNKTPYYTVVAITPNIPRRNSWSMHGIFVNYIEPPNVAWRMSMVQTYVKLKRGVGIEQVNLSLLKLVDKYVPLDQANASAKSSDNLNFTLLNIAELHLFSGGQQGNMQRIWMLYGLAAVIVFLSAINYINLAMAHYSRRQKEIALRKTLGAARLNIIAQLITEAVVALSIALFLTLVALEPIMPWLGRVLDMEIEQNYWSDIRLLGSLIAIALLIGIAAGSYPGLYLSKIRPALTLKANKSQEANGSIRLRYALVVIQFCISIVMLISVALIAKQIATILNYDPGYETKNIVYLMDRSLIGADAGKINTLKNKISKLAGVEAVARTPPEMPGEHSQSFAVALAGQSRDKAGFIDMVPAIEADVINLLDIPIIAGKIFDPLLYSDKRERPGQIIIDQQTSRYLGFKSAGEAVGNPLDIYFSAETKETATIVAVTANVHVGSRDKPLHPVIFWLPTGSLIVDSLAIRFTDGIDKKKLLEKAKEIWKSELDATPGHRFMEDMIKKQYSNQIMMSHFVYVFSAVAMFISCFGLYGLASFTAEKRNKEIGLRKIHGASVRNIVGLLLWQFTQPVMLASIIAWPVALYIMSRWLEDFNQRIDLWLWGPVYCLLAGLLAIAIAWLAVGGRALLAARAKPVDALTDE